MEPQSPAPQFGGAAVATAFVADVAEQTQGVEILRVEIQRSLQTLFGCGDLAEPQQRVPPIEGKKRISAVEVLPFGKGLECLFVATGLQMLDAESEIKGRLVAGVETRGGIMERDGRGGPLVSLAGSGRCMGEGQDRQENAEDGEPANARSSHRHKVQSWRRRLSCGGSNSGCRHTTTTGDSHDMVFDGPSVFSRKRRVPPRTETGMQRNWRNGISSTHSTPTPKPRERNLRCQMKRL